MLPGIIALQGVGIPVKGVRTIIKGKALRSPLHLNQYSNYYSNRGFNSESISSPMGLPISHFW